MHYKPIIKCSYADYKWQTGGFKVFNGSSAVLNEFNEKEIKNLPQYG